MTGNNSFLHNFRTPSRARRVVSDGVASFDFDYPGVVDELVIDRSACETDGKRCHRTFASARLLLAFA